MMCSGLVGGSLVALRNGANGITVPGVIAGRCTGTDGEPVILEAPALADSGGQPATLHKRMQLRDEMEPGHVGSFASVLRQLRTQAGLSLRGLGKLALYDYSRLSRAERGEVLPPEPQVQMLDKVLHANGLLISLWRTAPEVPLRAPPWPARCALHTNG